MNSDRYLLYDVRKQSSKKEKSELYFKSLESKFIQNDI